eukprot:gene26856-41758_t
MAGQFKAGHQLAKGKHAPGAGNANFCNNGGGRRNTNDMTGLKLADVRKQYTERKENGKTVWDCNHCEPAGGGKHTVRSQPGLQSHIQSKHRNLMDIKPVDAGEAAGARAIADALRADDADGGGGSAPGSLDRIFQKQQDAVELQGS